MDIESQRYRTWLQLPFLGMVLLCIWKAKPSAFLPRRKDTILHLGQIMRDLLPIAQLNIYAMLDQKPHVFAHHSF